MPIRTLVPQVRVQSRLSTRLRDLAQRPRDGSGALSVNLADPLGLAAPHPIFNLDLDGVDRPDWLTRTQMTGWRYFVTSNQGVIAAAEAAASSVNGRVRGTLTNEGPFVAGTEEALAFVERRPEIAAGDFVLGLLRVPALYVVALWLRSGSREDKLDRFVPVNPIPSPLKANRLLTPDAFIAALRRLKLARAASGAGADELSN